MSKMHASVSTLHYTSSKEISKQGKMPGYRVSVRKGGGTQLPALVILLSLAATAAIVSILFWRLHYEAGFTWSEEPTNQFSWHPLLMSLCIILMGFGSIIYRVTPCIAR